VMVVMGKEIEEVVVKMKDLEWWWWFLEENEKDGDGDNKGDVGV